MADPLFRTNGPWGPGKGSNLEPAEVDENFWALLERIVNLEENPSTAKEISNFVVVGTQLTIFMEGGDSFGPYTLPTAQFAWTGAWIANGEEYKELDLVTVDGKGLYLVLQDHESQEEFDPNWETSEGPVYRLMFGVPNRLEVGAYIPGRPGADFEPESASEPEPFWYWVNTQPIIIPEAFAESRALLVGAQAENSSGQIYSIISDNAIIGSVEFAPGDSTGYFFSTLPPDAVLPAGQGLGLIADGSIDPVASGLSLTFVFQKG